MNSHLKMCFKSLLFLSLTLAVYTALAAANDSGQLSEPMSLPTLLNLNQGDFLVHELARVSQQHDPRVFDWPFYATTHRRHRVQIIDNGFVALDSRLRMIESAKTSIAYMTFDFQADQAGLAVLQALLDRALHGVRVRLLIDWFNESGHPGLTDAIVASVHDWLDNHGAPQSNFEVRYYNRGNVFENPIKINHRNHIKLVVVDQKRMLIGGRNTANAYFELNSHAVNYFDREMVVDATPLDENAPSSGSSRSAGQTQASAPVQASEVFDQYWTNRRWVSAAKSVAADEKVAKKLSLAAEAQAFRSRLSDVVADRLTRDSSDVKLYDADALTLVFDRPGHRQSQRRVTPLVHWRLANANRYILVENYQVPLSSSKRGVLSYLSEKQHTPILFLTAGFQSTDDKTTTRLAVLSEIGLLSSLKKLWCYQMSGQPLRNQIADQGQLVRWSQDTVFVDHTKSMVLFADGASSAWVGSYNFDPRSEVINNEAMLIVENNASVSSDLARRIQTRILEAREFTIDAKLRPWYVGDSSPIRMPKKPFLEVVSDLLGFGALVRNEY